MKSLVREFSVMCLVSSLVLALASPALAEGRADSKAEIRKAVIGTTVATFFVTEVMKSLTHDLIITPTVNFIKEKIVAPLADKYLTPVVSRVKLWWTGEPYGFCPTQQ